MTAESSTQNFSNIPSPTPLGTPVGSTPVAQQPVQPKTVDMTNVGGTLDTNQATPETEVAQEVKHFDTEKISSLPTKYIQANQGYFNPAKPTFIAFAEDADVEYSFGKSITDSNALTNSFKLGILRNQRDKNNFTVANQLFATLNNVNYKYSHHPILGNIRIAIDESGKTIGLPEAIDKDGNPIDSTPKNLPDLLPA